MTDQHDPDYRAERDFEPEGVRVAWKRFCGDCVRISHSYPNLGAEAAGSLGLPRRAGKVLALFILLCFVVWLVVK